MHEVVVKTAFYIGYSVMVAGGIAISLGLLSLVAGCAWRIYCAGMNMGDLIDAVEEWRKNHPDKATSLDKRNG